jgi:hypothetical protein
MSTFPLHDNYNNFDNRFNFARLEKRGLLGIRRVNKLKLELINKKEIILIKIMKYLCILFVIIINAFMIIHEQKKENSFLYLSTFLDENIFFNMSKISVAVLYIVSINIKWELNSCNISSSFEFLPLIYQNLLFENIGYLTWIKNFINDLGKEYREILLEKHDIELSVFGTTEKKKYKFDYDNLLTFFINSEINLLNQYPNYLMELKTKKYLDPLTIGLNELDDLSENTYLFFTKGTNGFKENEKNQIINKIFNSFPYMFICSGVALLSIFLIYTIYIFQLNKIETFLINKLLNFNTITFDNYIKHLDDIKKKLINESGEKDDLDITEIESRKTLNELKRKRTIKKKTIKKERNKQNKAQNQKKEKLKKMKNFFVKNNIFFVIKILLINIISLSYYIVAILIEKKQKNELLIFDNVNDSVIGFFKESYDIFISLKRELEIYERNLTLCEIDENKKVYTLNLPKI